MNEARGTTDPSANSDNIISMRNVTFGYKRNNVQILKGINIDVPRGSLVAIMGGSGSGKTTMLRLLTGQAKPAPGSEVVFDGERIDQMGNKDLYGIRRRMGTLLQFSGLFTDMSAGENVAFPLRENTGLSSTTIRDLVLLKLQAVGMRSAYNRYPSELSGGQQRRLALARAIAMDPDLLMYDEPFTGLDPVSLAVIANLIKSLNHALNATSVVITHDIEETFAIADFVYLLWQGSIIMQGTPQQLRDSQDPLVRQFVRGEADGPLPFHLPGKPLASDLRLPPGDYQANS